MPQITYIFCPHAMPLLYMPYIIFISFTIIFIIVHYYAISPLFSLFSSLLFNYFINYSPITSALIHATMPDSPLYWYYHYTVTMPTIIVVFQAISPMVATPRHVITTRYHFHYYLPRFTTTPHLFTSMPLLLIIEPPSSRPFRSVHYATHTSNNTGIAAVFLRYRYALFCWKTPATRRIYATNTLSRRHLKPLRYQWYHHNTGYHASSLNNINTTLLVNSFTPTLYHAVNTTIFHHHHHRQQCSPSLIL